MLRNNWPLSYMKRGAAGGGGGLTDDPFFNNVVLLIGADGPNGSTAIVDESSYAHALSVFGNAQISTAQSVFGGSSIAFDGSGDYLTAADSEDWNFGASNYTIEAWIRFNGSAHNTQFMGQQSGWAFNWSSTFGAFAGPHASTFGSGFTPAASTWYHICTERSGSTARFYVDGAVLGSTSTTSTVSDSADPVYFGRDFAGNGQFNGWIDEMRVTYGIARYDGAFTPPAAAFPRSAAATSALYRYYKIRCTGTNDGSGDCLFREINVAESNGGTDIGQCGRVTGTGGHYSAAEGPDKAINNSTGDWWQPRIPGGGSVEIVFDFMTKRTLHEAIFDPHPSFLNRTPTGIEILGSNDGSSYTSVATFSSLTGWTGARTLNW